MMLFGVDVVVVVVVVGVVELVLLPQLARKSTPRLARRRP
jgi:hypothetical protein